MRTHLRQHLEVPVIFGGMSGVLKVLFGFEAQVKFEEGLRRTIKWYREQSK